MHLYMYTCCRMHLATLEIVSYIQKHRKGSRRGNLNVCVHLSHFDSIYSAVQKFTKTYRPLTIM